MGIDKNDKKKRAQRTTHFNKCRNQIFHILCAVLGSQTTNTFFGYSKKHFNSFEPLMQLNFFFKCKYLHWTVEIIMFIFFTPMLHFQMQQCNREKKMLVEFLVKIFAGEIDAKKPTKNAGPKTTQNIILEIIFFHSLLPCPGNLLI